jgi:serine/threonine protein phosphatase PrpC
MSAEVGEAGLERRMRSPFTSAILSKPGGRKSNEDSADRTERDGVLCAVVADGLGGHAGGEVASRVVCEAAMASFAGNLEVSPGAIESHIRAADDALREQQVARPELATMRSTIVMLVANATHAVWGHVGDSRLYHFRDGAVVSQTKDHSVPQHLVDAGEIDFAAIRGHEDRNRLLSALGQEDPSRSTVAAEAIALREGDAFVLCTDGFWEHVVEVEMELDFAKSRLPSEWLALMEGRLRERVEGRYDNYTALAIQEDTLP